jgi:hypothetical protein
MGTSVTAAEDAQAWKQFWESRQTVGEHQFRDPATAAVLHGHWQDAFGALKAQSAPMRLIDLASGEGEVVRLARASVPAPDLTCFSADIALGAGHLAAQETAIPVVANCNALPFPEGAFDLVVSQFGLEYAGPEAFSEAGRMVCRGGRFHALVHCRGGQVETACQEVDAVLGAVQDAQLLDRTQTFADTVRRAVAGGASQDAAQASADALREALEGTARHVGSARQGPARDHVTRLIRDVQTLASRLGAYAPEDVSAWLDGQRKDLAAFQQRMQSMTRVAQSQEQAQALLARLEAAGLTPEPLEPLIGPDGKGSLAWVIRARHQTG